MKFEVKKRVCPVRVGHLTEFYLDPGDEFASFKCPPNSNCIVTIRLLDVHDSCDGLTIDDLRNAYGMYRWFSKGDSGDALVVTRDNVQEVMCEVERRNWLRKNFK